MDIAVDSSHVIALVSATTALMASVTGPVATLVIGRAQVRASVFAGNRQQWIDGFREAIAAYCSQVAVIVRSREKVFKDGQLQLTEPEMLGRFEALILVFTRIRLMMDPLDEEHSRLLALMHDLLQRLRDAPTSKDIEADAEAAGATLPLADSLRGHPVAIPLPSSDVVEAMGMDEVGFMTMRRARSLEHAVWRANRLRDPEPPERRALNGG